jgi:hypothetical protein
MIRDVFSGSRIPDLDFLHPGSRIRDKKAPDPQHRMYTALKFTIKSIRNTGNICQDVYEFKTCIKCASS